jgi:hypothetical protein
MRCNPFPCTDPFFLFFLNARGTDAPMLLVPTLSAPPSCAWAVTGLSKMCSRLDFALRFQTQTPDSPSPVVWVSWSSRRISSASEDVAGLWGSVSNADLAFLVPPSYLLEPLSLRGSLHSTDLGWPFTHVPLAHCRDGATYE